MSHHQSYADIVKINRPVKQETPVNVEKHIFLGDIQMSVGTANKYTDKVTRMK